jgi:hypothetical protein
MLTWTYRKGYPLVTVSLGKPSDTEGGSVEDNQLVYLNQVSGRCSTEEGQPNGKPAKRGLARP